MVVVAHRDADNAEEVLKLAWFTPNNKHVNKDVRSVFDGAYSTVQYRTTYIVHMGYPLS